MFLKKNKEQLEHVHNLHRFLTNAAIETRKFLYETNKTSISFQDQCKQLTQIRNLEPDFLSLSDEEINSIEYVNKLQECLYKSIIREYKGLNLQEKLQIFHEDFISLNAQSCQVTLKRVHLAFDNFFRRVKAGEEPGYPRFKARDRFSGFGYKTHGDGFKFTPKCNHKSKLIGGTLKLSGIGIVKLCGSMRTPGIPVASSITKKGDDWYCTLFVHCEPVREHGDEEAGLDLGTNPLIQLAYEEDGEIWFDRVENERFLKEELDELKELQRKLSGDKKSKKKRKFLVKKARKVANRRKNKLHQVSSKLIKNHSGLYSEELDVSNMLSNNTILVSSGFVMGKKQRAGLHRSVQDCSFGLLFRMIEYKAEEAGIRFDLLDTKVEKPTQTCPNCRVRRKKFLNERMHLCECGCEMTRDQASALYILRRGRELRCAAGTVADSVKTLDQKPRLSAFA